MSMSLHSQFVSYKRVFIGAGADDSELVDFVVVIVVVAQVQRCQAGCHFEFFMTVCFALFLCRNGV